MEKNKTVFWRGFTWKKFLAWTFFNFCAMLLIDLISVGFTGLTSLSLIKWLGRILISLILAFYMATDGIRNSNKSKSK